MKILAKYEISGKTLLTHFMALVFPISAGKYFVIWTFMFYATALCYVFTEKGLRKHLINAFHATGLSLYPLKKLENLWSKNQRTSLSN